MTFRRHLLAVLVVGSLLILSGVAGLCMFMTKSLVSEGHDGDFELVRDTFDAKLDAYEDEALEGAEFVTSVPAIRKAFVDRNRSALLAECGAIFKVQSEKYGVDQAQFHEPGAVSFLRLHEPAKFGDEQASYRPMLADAHREQAVRTGIEITRRGPVITGIVPIFDDTRRLSGTYEVGLDIAPLFDELKKDFELEGALYLDDNLLRSVATELPPSVLSAGKRLGPFTRFHTTNAELLLTLVKEAEVDVTEPQSFERLDDDTLWGVQLIPIFNYAHKRIGVVALATSFGDDLTAARRTTVWQGLAAVFGAVMLVGLILVVIRGWLLTPLREVTARLQSALRDENSPMSGSLYCSEIVELHRKIDELTAKKGST